MRKQVERALRSRLRPVAAALSAAAIAAFAAGAVAQESDQDPVSAEGAAMMQEIEAESDRAASYVESLWQGALDKAEARSLEADVDQAEAERILRDALDVPNDQADAERLEAEMIDLTAELRAAGDLPSLDDPTRFDDVGGPVFQHDPSYQTDPGSDGEATATGADDE